MADAKAKNKPKKWNRGVPADKINSITDEELEEYVTIKVYEYSDGRMTDSNLWGLFKDEFYNFTVEHFDRISFRGLRELRATLRCCGVRVQQEDENYTIAQSLMTILGERKQAAWTPQDIKDAAPDFEKNTIHSIYIKPEGSSRNTTSKPADKPQQPSRESSLERKGRPAQRSRNSTPDKPPRRSREDTPDKPPQRSREGTPTRGPTIGKLMGEIAKILTEDQKYDGSNGNFDHKFTIFKSICKRVELPETALVTAFPTMLKGIALDHFFTNQLDSRSLKEACKHIRNAFEGSGYTQRNLDEWNSITLATVMAKNPKKSTLENLRDLVNQLRNLQYGLETNLQDNSFFRNKLVTACQGVPACRYAVSDPPQDTNHLIHKLQSSIIAYEKENPDASNEAFFTDRRYRRNTSDRYPIPTRHRSPTSRRRRDGPAKCFICKK